jgi:hypothetical protein
MVIIQTHKGKVIPVHTMKVYKRSRGTAPSFLISALYGHKWSTSHPQPLYPQQKTCLEFWWAPETDWTFQRKEKCFVEYLLGNESQIILPAV